MLVDDLRVEWTVNPQYSYGWAVPFLCVYLVYARLRMGDRESELGVGKNQAANSHLLTPNFQLPTPNSQLPNSY